MAARGAARDLARAQGRADHARRRRREDGREHQRLVVVLRRRRAAVRRRRAGRRRPRVAHRREVKFDSALLLRCAEVRETSRKPDEMYDMLERLAPGQRKLELFGRPHGSSSHPPAGQPLEPQVQAAVPADRLYLH